jgi:multidrug efflux pump subunit AcrA (membrane-fusion protein)
MFAEAFFVREESTGTIVVPRSAVLIEDGATVVFLAEHGRAVRRAVSTGIDSGSEIEITGGLAEGEMLIVTGQTFVRDGAPIHIVETGGDAS